MSMSDDVKQKILERHKQFLASLGKSTSLDLPVAAPMPPLPPRVTTPKKQGCGCSGGGGGGSTDDLTQAKKWVKSLSSEERKDLGLTGKVSAKSLIKKWRKNSTD